MAGSNFCFSAILHEISPKKILVIAICANILTRWRHPLMEPLIPLNLLKMYMPLATPRMCLYFSDKKLFDFRVLDNESFSAPNPGTTPLTLSSLQRQGESTDDRLLMWMNLFVL